MSRAPRDRVQEFAIARDFEAERSALTRAIAALLLYELLELYRSETEDVWWRECAVEVEEKSLWLYKRKGSLSQCKTL